MDNYRYRSPFERYGLCEDDHAEVRKLTREIHALYASKGQWISLAEAFKQAAAIVRSTRRNERNKK